MKTSLLQQAAQFYQNRRRKQLWYRVVSGMACVVVFCTVYALILPAITLEKEPLCGLEEHTHTEDCYTTQTVWPSTAYLCDEESLLGHTHDETCYDEDDHLICGYADFVVHTHDDSCNDRNGDLVCPLPEIEEHEHDRYCYRSTAVLTCEQEETGHIHDKTCYTSVRGELNCGMEEFEGHIHSADCYTTVTELICGEEEITLHTHDEGCFDEDENLICGKVQVLAHRHDETCVVEMEGEPEEVRVLICGKEEHTHTDLCYEPQMPATEDGVYICGLEAHTHDETCYDESGELICGLEEHVHDESCVAPPEVPSYICGKEEHTHDETCYDESGELICGLEEHAHDETCLALPEVPLRELTYEGADYTVTVSFGEDAALPESVTLSAEEIAPDSEEYQTYYQQTLDTLTAQQTEGAEQVLFARFFDVQFMLDGQVLEPAAPVSVTITYDEPVETGEDVSCQAIHFTEDGPELLEVEAEGDPESGATSFTHTQESFSVVGSLVTRPLANPTDIGPNSLPVDYYVCIDGQWTRVGATRTGWYNNWNGTDGWNDYNRDYITVEQAASILGKYGFTGEEENPARKVAYQQKTGNVKLFSDTTTVEIGGKRVIPLARNTNGFNLYYLPANEIKLSSVASLELLDKAANGFYTVTVSGANGKTLASEVVKTGGSFTYDAATSGVTNWLVAYDDGTIETIETIADSTIQLTNITSTVHVSPYRGNVGSHSVTFKVLLDGVWQEVASLPYYYSGTVDGSQRAYITSDMAAQFFGRFGYTAATEPGYHFGYSYNDIYEIVYCDMNSKAPTNYCMDVADANYENGSAIQLYTRNGTDAQLFRIRTAEYNGGEEGYKYLTPLQNSSRQVNLLGSGEANGQKLVLWTSPTIHSSWKVVPEDGGLVSFQLGENTAYSIDVNGNGAGDSVQLQIYQNAGAKFWKLVQHYRVSNNTVSSQNEDGTYNIGLTAESNGDIVCYYMPGETARTYPNAAESAISTDGNGFWSVKVVDDSQGVYTVAQQAEMTQYVKAGSGTAVTVTVRNADGVLWACRGMNGAPVEVTSTQEDGSTTFVITNITQPIEVTATRANPAFTVQYYANIPRFATSGDATLTVIDTSAAGNNGTATLPTNGGNMATKSIYLKKAGWRTEQNAGEKTDLYQVATTIELTRMYAEGTFHYEESPELYYFNKLKDNESYELKEIWVLKAGKDPASTNRNDWTIYTYGEDTAFTNEAGQAGGNTILIRDGAVIRLVADTTGDDYYNGTTFYDYNISSGQNTDGRWLTGITGINIEGNYTANSKTRWKDGRDIIAFGNANCGTGMALYMFDGGTLNKYNSKNSKYGGTTFGLASGLNSDGTIKYNEWIIAPKLFNEAEDPQKPTTGKQTYTGSSLTFDRVGDTYTLKSATLKNSNGQQNTLSGLQYFFNPSPYGGKVHSNIYTNNFWPMDQAAGRTDALWGANGNPGKFQGFAEDGNPTNGWSDKAADFPVGDDGRAHNWFFGMNFALSFNLTKDYVGPLEYYFFGDDDLWVFLNNRLICDIGGVHSSVGEYVNLRDYLPAGSEGQYTLSFFYTERGDTGSTCYMSFTLPSVTSATTGRDIGQLQIGKTLGGDATGLGDVAYDFRVDLLTGENGSPLSQTFNYTVRDMDGNTADTYGTVKSGGTIKLKNGETALIKGLPAGTYYTVTELSTEGYKTTVNGQEGYITKGTVSNGGTAPANFVNTPFYELPQTGGTGAHWYTLGGLCLMAGALLLLYRTKTHGKGGKEYSC